MSPVPAICSRLCAEQGMLGSCLLLFAPAFLHSGANSALTSSLFPLNACFGHRPGLFILMYAAITPFSLRNPRLSEDNAVAFYINSSIIRHLVT